MARRRSRACSSGEGTAIPVLSPGGEEMPMHRYTHTIPAAQLCGGMEQQLQQLYQALTVQNSSILQMLSVLQELLEAVKVQEKGPGQ